MIQYHLVGRTTLHIFFIFKDMLLALMIFFQNREYSMREATTSLLEMGGATLMYDTSIQVLRAEYHRQGKSFPFSVIPEG